MIEGISAGLAAVFTLHNIAFLLVGCLTGTLIGMLPGLGPMTAIALMIPIASTLPAETSIMMMAAVYYGAIFGGSTSSILINAPGVASTVATSFDGYPMAKAGQPGKALAVAALASFAGGLIAALLLLLFAPSLAAVSLSFHSSDYFALMILGLVAVAAFGAGSELRKALLMTLVGLMLSTVGSDPTQGIPRFTLGMIDLMDGVSFLLLVMATFALSEALLQILRKPTDSRQQDPQTELTSQSKPLNLSLSRQDIQEASPAVVRSSLLGFFVGLLPGAGATIASLLAYGSEHRLAGRVRRAQFGHGSIRGLAAPEAANNAAATGSFVPLLTLGIPGSGTTAILLGAFIAYGVQPGPMLMISEPAVFWGVIVSMWLGNIVLLFLNLPMIPYLARLLSVRQQFLLPLILFFSLVGVYLVSFNTFDIQMMVIFAIVAVVFRLLDFPMAPMILGFILGGMIEENLQRALLIYDNSWSFLWQRPMTLIIMSLAVAVLVLPPLVNRFVSRR
ncbi:MAG: tripartite tricarboxylate transporter permease [Pseudomonadales bacterium]